MAAEGAGMEAEEETVTLRCLDSTSGDDNREGIMLSTADINSWDLTSILTFPAAKIKADRNRLIECSSYFAGLLSGSYSDSCLDVITIHWNLESFLETLRWVFGCDVDVTSANFVLLHEAALFFGVELLLLRCQHWVREITLSKGLHPPQLELGPLINVWRYGLEHASGFIQQLCISYLARNFMWALSCDSFVDIPYEFIFLTIQHPDLTVDSEKHLCNGILIWLAASYQSTSDMSTNEEKCRGLLKQVRCFLLPLSFVTGKRRCCFFSQFADEGPDLILRPATHSFAALTSLCDAQDCSRLRLRLTEYTKRVDLSGHPKIWPFLLLSLLSPSQVEDVVLRKNAKFLLEKIPNLTWDKSFSSRHLSPTLSFEVVEEVDISNCPTLDLEDALECFNKSFPSLKKLKAAHFMGFDAKRIHHLIEKCPLLCEIDLTVDISPVIPSKVSIASSSSGYAKLRSSISSNIGHDSWHALLFSMANPHVVHITRLTLEGRNDISDSGLRDIALLCTSLCYLNLNGCLSVTDAGISFLLVKCCNLLSLLACDTDFGDNSVKSLCLGISEFDSLQKAPRDQGRRSLAWKLQQLEIGGCKGVSETYLSELISRSFMLKHLCLKETELGESALSNFLGSSLETLDISETKVSMPCLAELVGRNPHLKCLIARGCRNLCNTEGGEYSNLQYTSRHLFLDIGKSCKLEEIAFGWGFLPYSLEALKPSIGSLKKMVIGLGGSLGQDGLQCIPTCCPLLETLMLYFQEISDALIANLTQALEHLQVLALCYCFGGISSLSLKFSLPSLRKLKLERVTPWMTTADLVTLTESCANLIELSLVGCRFLNSESQGVIARGWPGLVSMHLEDCGDLTRDGVSSLLNCHALEDLVLRHTGSGIPTNFITLAASELPMLRKLSIDICDSKDGDFDVPHFFERGFLSSVKIAKCKLSKCSLEVHEVKVRKTPVHKETLVLVWQFDKFTSTLVKERL